MGGFNPGGPDNVLQEFTANPHGLIYSSPVYFDGKVYIQGVGDVLKAFALKLDPATNTMMLDETPVSEGTTVSGFPGEVQSVSANGTTNGIVWSAQVDNLSGPAILRAYDANNLSTPLYASNQAGPRDTAGGGVKFTTPTIANGMVYLGTQFEVDAYGLLPQSPGMAQQGTVLQINLVPTSRGGPGPDPNLVNLGHFRGSTSPFWTSNSNAGVHSPPPPNGASPIASIRGGEHPTPADPCPVDPTGHQQHQHGASVSGPATGARRRPRRFSCSSPRTHHVGWNPRSSERS
jgi:hypothetical protein